MVSKSLGFNWGAAGVSTALFTGVYLADVLAYVRPQMQALKPHINAGAGKGHVIFEGADNDLPNGPYGTSQTLKWAMNKEKGMLLAWKMNGLDLEPDHGFPIRVVIPGQIGGRSVKWLRRIEVSLEESQHHLHFRDNKVLPTQITAQRARDEAKWWYDPKYIIRDLNTNSAIAVPKHGETLTLSSPSVPRDPTVVSDDSIYTVKGYAYGGGGRRVNRVEVSFDEGDTWELAEIAWPEDMYRMASLDDEIYGELDLTDRDTCFCWCFWSFDISMQRLAKAPSIFVRAMDDSLALQPRDMYWNATGMMNNWWFRVAVHIESGEGEETRLRFEHPTLAGVASGGWMERMKAVGQDILKPRFGAELTLSSGTSSNANGASPEATTAKPTAVIMTNPSISRQISIEEYQSLSASEVPSSKRKAMFIVNGEVYDGTPFLDEHPGGADSIWLAAGEPDASEDFIAIHSDDAKKKLVPYHIGSLSKSGEFVHHDAEAEDKTIFLNKRKWKTVTLTSVTPVSHDSSVFRFALSSPDIELGLPVGQHVFVRMRRKPTALPDTDGGIEGELVQRAYTPVSQQGARGYIDLLIKLYHPTEEFPSGGKMTMGFHQLVVGDTVELKGPLGSFVWQGRGSILWRDVPRTNIRKLGLICGGSGITPILQVLRAVLQDEGDQETELWLLDANKTEQDILCREELDGLARAPHGDGFGVKVRFRIHHTLGRPPDHWAFSKGRITDAMLEIYLPPPSDDAMILACGPEGMINLTVKPGLQRLGWNLDSSLVVF